MDFLASDAFLTIASVVASAIGIVLALRADIGRRIDRLEKRTKEGHQALGQRIDRVEEGLGQRIDRVEDRARADHQALVAEIGGVKTEIGGLKTAVSVLGAKLDERSVPQRLVVQEPPSVYTPGDEPEDGPEPE